MKIGIQTSCTDQTMPPGTMAAEVEARGFSTLLFAEHPHIPVTRDTDRPAHHGGGVLPEYYKRTWDPFVACSFAAAATHTLEIGTGICQLALRDPIVTAKSVASIDVLSGGRFNFGVGFGWNADEFVDHGIDFSKRHGIVREKIGVMKSLWMDDVASFSGKYVNLQPSWAWPKPATAPHPPLMVGGDGPVAMRHAAEWGDYWYPTSSALGSTPEQVVATFEGVATEFAPARHQPRIWVVALPGTDAETLRRYRDAGIARVNISMPAKPAAEQYRALDALAALRSEVLGSGPGTDR